MRTEELRVEPYPPRASSAGGQHVGTGPVGIKATHIPTGLSATCESERSQHLNRARALESLAALISASQEPEA